jgi:oxepin-CoA hydrolase/3-oxo-5,6-dehydrosuberyl-CoA semialdehyde dehydrogenase
VISLAARGLGSLAASVVTADAGFAHRVVLAPRAAGTGRPSCSIATMRRSRPGMGLPLPMLVHGGPGRPAGGEGAGGIRRVVHHMRAHGHPGQPAHAEVR